MNIKNLLISFLFLYASFMSACQVATFQSAQVPAKATPSWPTNDWPVSSPEDQGLESEKLQRMFSIIDEFPHLEIHSVLIIRKGYIVAEKYYPPYDDTRKNALFSCTKSVISALVGIAITEGQIKGVNQPVLDYFPEQLSVNPDPLKNQITMEDLLTMRSGLEWYEGNTEYQGMYTSRDWVGFVVKKPMNSEPGSRFNYCSGCSHVLSGVIRAATEMTTQDFANSRLFTPLGITDYYWEQDASGNAIGGWGLELTARDMAKFGYLYLHNGVWEDKQIIPAEWISQSTQMQVKTSDKWGYGYQWWVKPSTRTYAAQGLHGQQIYVIPDQDIIIVVTAGKDDGAVLGDLVFNSAIAAIR